MTRPAVILPILVVFSILLAVVVWRLVWVFGTTFWGSL